MLDSLEEYESLAGEIIPRTVLEGLSPKERRVVGFLVYQTIRKLSKAIHDENGFRVKKGIEKARKLGVRIGRPPSVDVDALEIVRLRAGGMSWRSIAFQTNTSTRTAMRIFRRATRDLDVSGGFSESENIRKGA